MYSEAVKTWFDGKPQRRLQFDEKFEHLKTLVSQYTSFVEQDIGRMTGINVAPAPSIDLLNEVIVDAISDLERISKFHDTPIPNRLKEAAYIVYWFLKHKPIALDRKIPMPSNAGLDSLAQFRLRFINEEFCVRFIMGAVFPNDQPIKSVDKDWLNESIKRRETFKEFLLYYLVYRLESAKSLEAVMLAMTISPAWEIDPVIWKNIDQN